MQNSSYALFNIVPWLIGCLAAYAIVRTMRLDLSGFVPTWNARSDRRGRVILWIVLAGLFSEVVGRLFEYALVPLGASALVRSILQGPPDLDGWAGGIASAGVLVLYYFGIVFWLLLIVLSWRLLGRATWEVVRGVCGWVPLTWQKLFVAAVIATAAAWPTGIPMSLWQNWVAMSWARYASIGEYAWPIWASAAAIAGTVVGFCLGGYVAHGMLRELREWWVDYPDWARAGWPHVVIWLSLTGMLAGGIVSVVWVATSIGRDLQAIIEPVASAGGSGIDTPGASSAWFTLLLHVLPLAAYLLADKVARQFDLEELDRRIDWYPSTRQWRMLLLVLASWLLWPLEVPIGLYEAMPRLGLDQADAVRFALGAVVAAALIWLFAFYRPGVPDDTAADA